jgi:3-mercaptopyruvate sulfurtransferase SseA
MTESDWQERVKGLLKAELKRRGMSYKQLAEKLNELGVEENDRNIANKLARGGFSAVFLIQCLEAAGCKVVHLPEFERPHVAGKAASR